MRAFKLTVAALVSLSMAAPAFAKNPNRLGHGDYFVLVIPGGLPHVPEGLEEKNKPVSITTNDFENLLYLDDNCHQQMDHLRPSMLKSVFLTELRNAPGIALGTAYGAKWAFGAAVSTAQYAKYGGLSGVGGSLGSAITSHEYGKHYLQGMCMQALVDGERGKLNVLKNIRILINPFAVNGHRLKRPSGNNSADTADSSSSSDDDDSSTSPPVMHP